MHIAPAPIHNVRVALQAEMQRVDEMRRRLDMTNPHNYLVEFILRRHLNGAANALTRGDMTGILAMWSQLKKYGV